MDRVIPSAPKRVRWYAGAAVVGAAVITSIALQSGDVPRIDDANLQIDTVRRGELIRQVHGTGSLVPEQTRIVSASVSGKIERILVTPGQRVGPSTLLMQLTNTNVELELIEAQRLLAAAEARLTQMPLTIESDQTNQESAVIAARMALNEARRQLDDGKAILAAGLITPNEMTRRAEVVQELESRLKGAERRVELARASAGSQTAAQRGEVERLRRIVSYRQRELSALDVRAESNGTVQEIGASQSLATGQWVGVGTQLVKLLQPGSLKAVVRIGEAEVAEVTPGQSATVDTHGAVIHGTVTRVDPTSRNGMVSVDIRLDQTLPQNARPDLSIDATIETARIGNALYIDRAALPSGADQLSLFRVSRDGRTADLVHVRTGRSSVSQLEVLGGLGEGDRVIVSDMEKWAKHQRVRLN